MVADDFSEAANSLQKGICLRSWGRWRIPLSPGQYRQVWSFCTSPPATIKTKALCQACRLRLLSNQEPQKKLMMIWMNTQSQTHLVFLCCAYIFFSVESEGVGSVSGMPQRNKTRNIGSWWRQFFGCYLIVPLKRSFSGVEPTYRMWTLANLGLMLVTCTSKER